MSATDLDRPTNPASAPWRIGLSPVHQAFGHLALVGLYFVIALVMLDPLPRLAATHVRDMADPLEWSWVLGYGARQLLANPLALFDGNIFYPFRNTLAFGESSVASILFAAPIVWATDNPVLAQNVLILASFVLAGYGTYLLVTDLTGSRLAGLIAGIVFAFCPYRMEKTVHLPFVSNQWLPLAFFALNRFLRGGRIRWAVIFGIFLATQFLTSLTLAFVAVFALAAYLGIIGLARPRSLARPCVFLPLLSVAILAGACLLVISLPYFDVARRYEMLRDLAEIRNWSARPGSYLAPNSYQLLWGQVDALTELGEWERHAFPGLLPYLLAALGAASCAASFSRRFVPPGASARDPRNGLVVSLSPSLAGLGFGVAGVVCFALSLGPVTLHVPLTDLSLSLPYVLLYDHLPGFQSMRVPARFAAGVLLAASVLAGLGAARLLGWVARLGASGPIWRIPLALLLAAVVIAEQWSAPPPLKPVPSGATIPPVYQWLRAQPEKSAIAEYPISVKGDLQEEATYYAAFHGWKVVNGWRSFTPPGHRELADRLPEFGRRDALQVLANIGVRYIVVHEAPLQPEQIAEARANLDRWGDDVRLVQAFGQDRLYELLRPPLAQSVRISIKSPCDAVAGAELPVDLVYRTPETTVVGLIDPPDRLALSVEWRLAGEGRVALRQTIWVDGPDALLGDGRIQHQRVLTPDEPGLYRLAIASLAPEISPFQEIAPPRTVVVRAESTAGVADPPRLVGVSFRDSSAGPDRPLRVETTWSGRCPCECQDAVRINIFDSGYRVWSAGTGLAPADLDRCLATESAATHEVSLRPDVPAGFQTLEITLIDRETGERREFNAPDGERVTRYSPGRIRVYDAARGLAERAKPAHRADTVFDGRVSLAGWSISPEPLRVGDDPRLDLFWQVREPLAADYNIFLHLYDASGKLVAQNDGAPGGGAWPTSGWRTGDVIVDQHTLKLPSDMEPGEYTLAAGVYDLATGRRLPIAGGADLGDNRLLLTRLAIAGR